MNKKIVIIIQIIISLLVVHKLQAQVIINDEARLSVGSDVYLLIGDDLEINSGGIMQIAGYTTVSDALQNSNGTDGLVILSDAQGTGSLIQSSESVEASVQRYLSQTYYHYISSPVSNQSISPEFVKTTPNPLPTTVDFYKWDEPTSYWINIKDESGNLNTGFETHFAMNRGYIIAYSNSAYTRTFTGTLNYQSKTLSMNRTPGTGGEGWNLVGNHFPCFLAANSNADPDNNFLGINSDVLDDVYTGIYYWDESIDDYVTVNQASSANFINPGQAFMVRAKNNGDELSIPTAIRNHGNSDFYKNAYDHTGRCYCGLTGPSGDYNEIELAFINGMSFGLDKGYDAAKFKANQNLAFYSLLVDDMGKDFIIQSLPALSDSLSVKIGLDAWETGLYKIHNCYMENLTDGIRVFLEDKYEHTITELNMNNEYNFNISETGRIDNRFVLHFYGYQTGLDPAYPAIPNLFAWYDGSGLYIQNNENRDLIARIDLLGLSGQLVKQWNKTLPSGNPTRLAYSTTGKGMYLLVIRTNKNVVTQKIILY